MLHTKSVLSVTSANIGRIKSDIGPILAFDTTGRLFILPEGLSDDSRDFVSEILRPDNLIHPNEARKFKVFQHKLANYEEKRDFYKNQKVLPECLRNYTTFQHNYYEFRKISKTEKFLNFLEKQGYELDHAPNILKEIKYWCKSIEFHLRTHTRDGLFAKLTEEYERLEKDFREGKEVKPLFPFPRKFFANMVNKKPFTLSKVFPESSEKEFYIPNYLIPACKEYFPVLEKFYLLKLHKSGGKRFLTTTEWILSDDVNIDYIFLCLFHGRFDIRFPKIYNLWKSLDELQRKYNFQPGIPSKKNLPLSYIVTNHYLTEEEGFPFPKEPTPIIWTKIKSDSTPLPPKPSAFLKESLNKTFKDELKEVTTSPSLLKEKELICILLEHMSLQTLKLVIEHKLPTLSRLQLYNWLKKLILTKEIAARKKRKKLERIVRSCLATGRVINYGVKFKDELLIQETITKITGHKYDPLAFMSAIPPPNDD